MIQYTKIDLLVHEINNEFEHGVPSFGGGKVGGAILKIAIVVSHPIQHFCPQYVSFAENENIELKVFFGSVLGYKKYVDVNFKEEIAWSNLNLDKFEHVFLNGDAVLQADKNLDAASLEKELELFNPGLLIGYGYFQKLQRRAKRWAVKNKIRFAYISDAEGRQQRHPLKELVKSLMLTRYFKSINYFLTVGDANEAYYRRYGVPDEKMLRMHFPIDVKQYKKSFENKADLRKYIRQKYGIGEDEIVLSVVVKLSPWKNQDHIIHAMLLLEQRGTITHFFILGSGEKKEDWQQQATLLQDSKVFFPGFVSIEELPAYYAVTDIYVHPASVEPHSIAISEAIYMGCPVILSNRCGSYGEADDVKDGTNGIVFPFGDTQALAAAIEKLGKDDELRKSFSAASHERALVFQELAHRVLIEKLLEMLAK